jgi:hypothetical protein
MNIVQTTIGETSVQMRLADNADAQAATQWIEFCVPIAELKAPGGSSLGVLEGYYLAELRLAALRYVRDVIGGETQRLSEFAGRIR